MINTSDHKALVAEIRYQSTNKDTNKTKHKKNQKIKIDWENNEIKKYTKEQQNKKWIKLKY
jgi:3-isopropylmalate dehydratase small subunit